MRDLFFTTFDDITRDLRGDEILTGWFSGEESDFVRFNKGRVRQSGTVTQASVELTLIDGRCHAECTTSMSGTRDDFETLRHCLTRLRELVENSEPDPFLIYCEDTDRTEDIDLGPLPDGASIAEEVCRQADGQDFVGFLALGPVYRGFASSLGARRWFAKSTFNLDWSVYHRDDKAAKASYAGFVWDGDEFARRAKLSIAQADVLGRPQKTLAPGKYDVFLAPAAVSEILDLLGWGGFGLRAHQTKSSPFRQLREGTAALDARIGFAEDARGGGGPTFNAWGFTKPDCVDLVRGGRIVDTLCSPRSSAEFSVQTNGAGGAESPQSLVMYGGNLAMEDAHATLDRGLYISNLWYLNYSDRNACRMTGMTRFATSWVEDGNAVAPVGVMRFDESLFELFGPKVVDITREQELILSGETYDERSVSSSRVPGLLARDFRLTL
jgi:predicted Zn-dependent protease